MEASKEYQVIAGDYFFYHGDVVKVLGRSVYNERDYSVDNSRGNKIYAELDELMPIPTTDVWLKRAGVTQEDESLFTVDGAEIWIYKNFEAIIKYEQGEILFNVRFLHQLQNALRLFGIELNLKQIRDE